MENLFNWIKNIAYFLILLSVIWQVLPDGRYRKYFRFVSGMVLIILVAAPLSDLGGWEEKLAEAAERFSWEQDTAELEYDIRLADENMIEQLENEYEAIIRDQVSALVSKYGFSAAVCEAKLELDKESETFGNIESLKVILAADNYENKIWIEPVEIGDEETISDNDVIMDIRSEIQAMYSLSDDKLIISLIE